MEEVDFEAVVEGSSSHTDLQTKSTVCAANCRCLRFHH